MIINYCDINMHVEYSYEEAEPETYDYPGSPDSAVLESVSINGVDILEMLSVEQYYDIEGIVLQKIRERNE